MASAALARRLAMLAPVAPPAMNARLLGSPDEALSNPLRWSKACDLLSGWRSPYAPQIGPARGLEAAKTIIDAAANDVQVIGAASATGRRNVEILGLH